MTLLLILIVAALLFGGVGFFVEAAAWALFVAVFLIVAGVVSGLIAWRTKGRQKTV